MNIYQDNNFCAFNQTGFVPGTKLNHGDFKLDLCQRVSPQQNVPYATWDNLTSILF